MTWVTTTAFINTTGVTIDPDIVNTALEEVESAIKRRIFISREERFAAATSYIVLLGGERIMDNTGDSLVTTSDITIFELDSVEGTYIDRADKMTSFDENTGLLQLSEDLPASLPELVIRYKEGRDQFDLMLIELRRLEKLEATDYLFENVPVSKLESGITSWNLNGVSVTFDLSAMQQVMEQNAKSKKQLYNDLRPQRGPGYKPGEIQHQRLYANRRNQIQPLWGGGGFRVW